MDPESLRREILPFALVIGAVVFVAAAAAWCCCRPRSKVVETAADVEEQAEEEESIGCGGRPPRPPNEDSAEEEEPQRQGNADQDTFDAEMLAAEEEQRAQEREELEEYAASLRAEVAEALRMGKRGRQMRALEEKARAAEQEVRRAGAAEPRPEADPEVRVLCCSRAARLAAEQSRPEPLVMNLAALGQLGPRCLAKRCGRVGSGGAAYQTLDTLGHARSAVGCARSSPEPGVGVGDEEARGRWDDAATHVY